MCIGTSADFFVSFLFGREYRPTDRRTVFRPLLFGTISNIIANNHATSI